MVKNLSSVGAVAHVYRLDGSAHIVRVYWGPALGWERPVRRERLTIESIRRLSGEGVRTVELRRWWHRGRIPLSWFGRVAVSTVAEPRTAVSTVTEPRAVVASVAEPRLRVAAD